MIYILTFLMLSVSPSEASDVSDKIDLLWKARGLQAEERIDKLRGKSGTIEIGKLTQKQTCDLMLEGAYFGFARSNTWKMIRQKNETGNTLFSLIFMSGDEKSPLLANLTYTYGKTETMPSGLSVTQAHQERVKVFLVKEDPKTLFIKADECVFGFPIEDPFGGYLLKK